MPSDSEAKQSLEAEPYRVGYKKPPLETRFGAQRQPGGARAAERPNIDIAALLDEPLQVKSKGKKSQMHLHEATLHGLFKRLLKGETRANKQFLDYCRRAEMFQPSELASAGPVVEAPRGVPLELARLLIQEVGVPPWDKDVLAAYRATYERECAEIAVLKDEALKQARANGQDVY